VDLTDTVGLLATLFDPDALARAVLLNASTGRKGLYALPIGRTTNHIHVWKSILEEAGFSLSDIPKEWEVFWAFWCDHVQPAVRRATGRDQIWAVGLPMSVEAADTWTQFFQFMAAYEADYVTPDGKLIIDDPTIRERLVRAIDSYTAVYRKGCTPPNSLTWGNIDNNQAFLSRAVVMTANDTLSIPNALKRDRSEDYYKNTATVDWPRGPQGKSFPIMGEVLSAAVFNDGGHVATAKAFVRFLVEGWLAHYHDFAAERFMPPMSKLLEQPFWLDPRDPHRMASVIQISSRPLAYDYATVSGNWRQDLVEQDNVWGKAVHRIAADGIAPEQAVDEAIARIKQILKE
jgi:multiple sugar transport system substrate-binding protein